MKKMPGSTRKVSGCGSVYQSKKKKKKKDSVSRPAANIREPLVLGRMFGCRGEEQWLFNLLFIAKPIWEEWRQEPLRRASFPWGPVHLLCGEETADSGQRACHCCSEPRRLARMLAHTAGRRPNGVPRVQGGCQGSFLRWDNWLLSLNYWDICSVTITQAPFHWQSLFHGALVKGIKDNEGRS